MVLGSRILTGGIRLAIGIKDELVRYSVGIEEEDELIADIDQALNKI